MMTRFIIASAFLHSLLVLGVVFAQKGASGGNPGAMLVVEAVRMHIISVPTNLGPAAPRDMPLDTGGQDGRTDTQPRSLPTGQTFAKGSGVARGPDGVTSAISAAHLLKQTVQSPRFTKDALAAGFDGLLVLELYVDEEGRVVKTTLLNPTGFEIDGEALRSARAARYLPARNSSGQPIASSAELRFRFVAH